MTDWVVGIVGSVLVAVVVRDVFHTLFHPIGRAALAARRHRELTPTDVLDPVNVRRVLANAGWTPELVDDSDERYLTVARIEG